MRREGATHGATSCCIPPNPYLFIPNLTTENPLTSRFSEVLHTPAHASSNSSASAHPARTVLALSARAELFLRLTGQKNFAIQNFRCLFCSRPNSINTAEPRVRVVPCLLNAARRGPTVRAPCLTQRRTCAKARGPPTSAPLRFIVLLAVRATKLPARTPLRVTLLHLARPVFLYLLSCCLFACWSPIARVSSSSSFACNSTPVTSCFADTLLLFVSP